MKQTPLRTVVADDHRLFRQGLISLMATRPDLVEVVGEAQSGNQAVSLCHALDPDLILLDIYMSPEGGLEAAQMILTECPGVDVVMLTASALDEHLDRALRMGVSGYLLKDLDANELFDLVEGVARGEVAVTRALATRVLKGFAATAGRTGEDADELTSREMDVLRLVARGYSNPQIARELYVTVNTVKAHMKRILMKLHLENRTQIAAYAVRKGYVPDEEP